MTNRVTAMMGVTLLWAVVTVAVGAFVFGMSERAAACDCDMYTDLEAYSAADVVFTGTLVEINSPPGDIVRSSDPERFVFDVDQVFKGEAQARQSVVTAREGASCGLEISGPGPFVVFARIEPDGVTSGAVDGEVYSSLCSGTRPLSDAPAPASFGEPSPPVAATGESPSPGAAPSATSIDDNSPATFWVVAIGGVLALGGAGAFAVHRHRRSAQSDEPLPSSVALPRGSERQLQDPPRGN